MKPTTIMANRKNIESIATHHIENPPNGASQLDYLMCAH